MRATAAFELIERKNGSLFFVPKESGLILFFRIRRMRGDQEELEDKRSFGGGEETRRRKAKGEGGKG